MQKMPATITPTVTTAVKRRCVNAVAINLSIIGIQKIFQNASVFAQQTQLSELVLQAGTTF
jgi:hypothetical protein